MPNNKFFVFSGYINEINEWMEQPFENISSLHVLQDLEVADILLNILKLSELVESI